MKPTVAAVVVATLSLTAIGHARADQNLEADATATVDVSYRGQIVLADLASLATFALGAGAENEGIADVGAAGLFLAAPAVHLAHGNPGRALASATLRGGLTFGGAYLGASTCSQSTEKDGWDDWDCLGAAALGGIVGFGTATIIDAAFLAKQTRTVAGPSWSPQVAVTRGGAQLGISGSF